MKYLMDLVEGVGGKYLKILRDFLSGCDDGICNIASWSPGSGEKKRAPVGSGWHGRYPHLMARGCVGLCFVAGKVIK